jgi:hypothetical protein
MRIACYHYDKNGKLHRENGPAVERTNGGENEWWLNGRKYSEEQWKTELEKVKENNKVNGASKLQTIRVKKLSEVPKDFTGIVEFAGGDKWWYLNGNLHREDGPACEFANGTKNWFLNSLIHREDGPAIEHANGKKHWFLYDMEYFSENEWKKEVEKLRENQAKETNFTMEVVKDTIKTQGFKSEYDVPKDFTGTARIAGSPGMTCSLVNGKYHNEYGPAIEIDNGTKKWFKNGKLHNLLGPAIVWSDGSVNYCIDGVEIEKDRWELETEKLRLFTEFHKLQEKETKKVSEKEKAVGALKSISVKNSSEIPKDFTGIAEYTNGNKIWYLNGKYHRENGPAIEWLNGNKEWWLNGDLCRNDGPAIEWVDGRKFWYLNGKIFFSENAWKTEFEKTKEFKSNIIQSKSLLLDDIPDDFTGIVESSNGDKQWLVNGLPHRVEGPAIEYANGTKNWFLNGEFLDEEEWKIKRLELARHYENYGAETGPTLKIKNYFDVPKNFIGSAISLNDRRRLWFLNGEFYWSESDWKRDVLKMKNESANNDVPLSLSQMKTEAKTAGKRILSKRLMKLVKSMVLALLTKQFKTAKLKNSAALIIEETLKTVDGEAVFSFFLGATIPYLGKIEALKKYSNTIESFAEEMRVSGIATVEETLFDKTVDLLPSLISDLSNVLNEKAEVNEEKVRVLDTQPIKETLSTINASDTAIEEEVLSLQTKENKS